MAHERKTISTVAALVAVTLMLVLTAHARKQILANEGFDGCGKAEVGKADNWGLDSVFSSFYTDHPLPQGDSCLSDFMSGSSPASAVQTVRVNPNAKYSFEADVACLGDDEGDCMFTVKVDGKAVGVSNNILGSQNIAFRTIKRTGIKFANEVGKISISAEITNSAGPFITRASLFEEDSA